MHIACQFGVAVLFHYWWNWETSYEAARLIHNIHNNKQYIMDQQILHLVNWRTLAFT